MREGLYSDMSSLDISFVFYPHKDLTKNKIKVLHDYVLNYKPSQRAANVFSTGVPTILQGNVKANNDIRWSRLDMNVSSLFLSLSPPLTFTLSLRVPHQL